MAGYIAAAQAGLSIFSAKKAKRQTKRERRRQEHVERLMTAEELRRLGKEQEQVLSGARAQIAASGFTGYGETTQAYLNELQAEQGREREWIRQVGASKAVGIRRAGKARESAYTAEQASSLLKGIRDMGEAFNWGTTEAPPPKRDY